LAWRIKYADSVLKQLKKLDKQIARQIIDYMSQKVAVLDDPKTQGKALTGELGELWRYRLGDFRIVCQIENEEVTIIVVRVAHRSTVFDDQKKNVAKANEEIEKFRASEKQKDEEK
jgi:mRNA interferase RelE/StbE